MLKASKFLTAIYQATIFTPDISAFSTSRFLAIILGKYAERYNGAVQALPIPEYIPPEFPRVVLQSEDGLFKLEASPGRITSFFIQNLELQAELDDISNKCVEVLEYYVQETKVSVNRLAMVLTRVNKCEHPAQMLIDKFCKYELQNTLFEGSKNFEIHSHKQVQLKEFTINSWVRCKTGTLLFSDIPLPGVIFEQDLNSLASEIEQRKFDNQDIYNYFILVLQEAQDVLRIYFPEEN